MLLEVRCLTMKFTGPFLCRAQETYNCFHQEEAHASNLYATNFTNPSGNSKLSPNSNSNPSPSKEMESLTK